jgi:hypothetical protein
MAVVVAKVELSWLVKAALKCADRWTRKLCDDIGITFAISVNVLNEAQCDP